MSSHFQGSRASVQTAVALEDKCHSNKCPSSLLSLSFYCWADVIRSVWVSCPGYAPSQDLAHPPGYWMRGGNIGETVLMLEHCSAAAKTLGFLSTHFQLSGHSTAVWGLFWGSELHLRQTQCTLASTSSDEQKPSVSPKRIFVHEYTSFKNIFLFDYTCRNKLFIKDLNPILLLA